MKNALKFLTASSTLLLLLAAPAYAGSYYSWSNSLCTERSSPEGYFIRFLDSAICEQQVGFGYQWTPKGKCTVTTPAGAIVRYVDNAVCVQMGGIVVVK